METYVRSPLYRPLFDLLPRKLLLFLLTYVWFPHFTVQKHFINFILNLLSFAERPNGNVTIGDAKTYAALQEIEQPVVAVTSHAIEQPAFVGLPITTDVPIHSVPPEPFEQSLSVIRSASSGRASACIGEQTPPAMMLLGILISQLAWKEAVLHPPENNLKHRLICSTGAFQLHATLIKDCINEVLASGLVSLSKSSIIGQEEASPLSRLVANFFSPYQTFHL